MTEDRGREYMNSRRVAKEYEAVTRGINKNMPSIPPMNIPEEATQVSLQRNSPIKQLNGLKRFLKKMFLILCIVHKFLIFVIIEIKTH